MSPLTAPLDACTGPAPHRRGHDEAQPRLGRSLAAAGVVLRAPPVDILDAQSPVSAEQQQPLQKPDVYFATTRAATSQTLVSCIGVRERPGGALVNYVVRARAARLTRRTQYAVCLPGGSV